MTDDQFNVFLEKFSVLQGQLLATQVAIRSMILMHSDRAVMANTLSDELDQWAASGLYSTVPESTLQGFVAAKGRLLPSADDLQRFP